MREVRVQESRACFARVIAHHYWSIEIDKIWEILTDFVPGLRARLDTSRISKE